MKRAQRRSGFYILVIGMCCSCSLLCQEQYDVHDVSDDIHIIRPLKGHVTVPVPQSVLELVQWPARTDLGRLPAPVDRTGSIPPLLPDGVSGDAKPIRVGARHPDLARREAEFWIRAILVPALIPSDLRDRLILIQDIDPSRSKIVCRFRISDRYIQVCQTQTFMWVVVRAISPVGATDCSDAAELGGVFLDTFNKGTEMAEARFKTAQSTHSSTVCVRSGSSDGKLRSETNWWGWKLCYSDGQALGVLFEKISENSAHSYAIDEPWF